MRNSQVEIAVSAVDILGEVPLWCGRTQRLWWIDVRRPSLQSYDPAVRRHEVFIIPAPVVGSYALRRSGGMMLALNDGFYAFVPGQELTPLLLYRDLPQNRYNDGKCDRRGRFWVGTMNNTPGNPEGSLYRIDPDFSVHPQFGGIYCPNSLAFSPDDRLFYFADTKAKLIWVFDFDVDAGEISGRRLLCDLTDHPGSPDGSTVDAEGFLWNAAVGGWRLVRYAPDGRIDRVVELPVSQPTSCAFGGPDLSILFVTTAAQNIPAQHRSREPHAGALLMVDVGVKGCREPLFAG
jgi:sugar lactone lactonase YvrE